jgi:SAM-dependent methyltransferase
MRGLRYFIRDYRELRKQQKHSVDGIQFGRLYPCLEDRWQAGGTAQGHYFYQDLLVASRIFHSNPIKHVDIGSRVDGFVAHVASFREIEVVDIRPITNAIPNVIFRQADLMDSGFNLEDYCASISSLHAIEHFGLGRYGDQIDYSGHLKGLENIYRMLQKGGKFYFSAPIGQLRIEFNAHRVFSIKYLLQLFEGKYSIDMYSYVNDKGYLITNAVLDGDNVETNFNCNFGCGIFELTKL